MGCEGISVAKAAPKFLFCATEECSCNQLRWLGCGGVGGGGGEGWPVWDTLGLKCLLDLCGRC